MAENPWPRWIGLGRLSEELCYNRLLIPTVSAEFALKTCRRIDLCPEIAGEGQPMRATDTTDPAPLTAFAAAIAGKDPKTVRAYLTTVCAFVAWTTTMPGGTPFGWSW